MLGLAEREWDRRRHNQQPSPDDGATVSFGEEIETKHYVLHGLAMRPFSRLGRGLRHPPSRTPCP